MQGLLYEQSPWSFIIVTVLMGGWAAWMTGRAVAKSWRPYWHAVVYLLLLTAAVRFIQFALFGGILTSAYFYLVDALVLVAVGSLGFRYTRARQMTTQYRWLYERTGPFSWRDRAAA